MNVEHEHSQTKVHRICVVSIVLCVAMQAFRLHKAVAEAARA